MVELVKSSHFRRSLERLDDPPRRDLQLPLRAVKQRLALTMGSAKSVTHAATCNLTTEVAEDHRDNSCGNSLFLCELCGKHLGLAPIYHFAIPLEIHVGFCG